MEIFFEPKIGTIVGPEREGIWSGTFWHEPESDERLSEKGRLYLVLTLGLPPDFSSPSQLTHSLWAEISKNYFENQGGVLTSLQKAITGALSGADKAISPYRGALAGREVHFGLSGAVLWGRVLYVAKVGEAQIRIARERKIRPLFPPQSVTPDNIFSKIPVQVASGYLERDDFVILESKSFQEAFSDDELSRILAKTQDPLGICEELMPQVHEMKNASYMAALLLKSGLAQVPSEEEIVAFATVSEDKVEIPQVEEEKSVKEDRVQKFIKRLDLAILKRTFAVAKLFVKKINPLPALFSAKSLYLRDARVLKERKRFLVVLLLLVLLLVFSSSVFWGVRQRGKTQERQEFTKLISEATAMYEEAKAVLELNRIRARELLSDAEDQLRKAEGLGIQKSKVKELGKKVSELELQALKITQIDSPSLFFDLSLIKKEARGDSLVFLPLSLLVLDRGQGAVYKVEENKSSREYAIQAASGSLLTAQENSAFLVKPDEGVFEVNLETGQSKKALEKDTVWGNLVDAASFAGNIYLLDPAKNQIWKYVGGAGGFSTGQKYLSQDQNIDLSGTSSFAIDGAIWILTADGKVIKTVQGKGDVLNIDGLDGPFSPASIIETNADSQFVYVLDRGGKRVVRFLKEGEYDSQYKGEFLKDAKDIAVDEAAGNLYVLLESKIFVIKL